MYNIVEIWILGRCSNSHINTFAHIAENKKNIVKSIALIHSESKIDYIVLKKYSIILGFRWSSSTFTSTGRYYIKHGFETWTCLDILQASTNFTIAKYMQSYILGVIIITPNIYLLLDNMKY